MFAGKTKLRHAITDDCELLWKWANDPVVRQSAFDSRYIKWEDHQAWFSNKQNDPNCYHYIAFNGQNVPIGQIRFDIKGSMAEIDYSLDRNFRNRGLGTTFLKAGIDRFRSEMNEDIEIRGNVKKGNISSIRVFQNNGFIQTGEKTFAETNGVNEMSPYTLYRLQLSSTKKAE